MSTDKWWWWFNWVRCHTCLEDERKIKIRKINATRHTDIPHISALKSWNSIHYPEVWSRWHIEDINLTHPNYLGAFGETIRELHFSLLPPLTGTRTWCSELKRAFNIVNQNKLRSQPATRYISFCRTKHFTVHYCVTKCFVYRKGKQQFIHLFFQIFPRSREGQRRSLNKWIGSSETQMLVQTEFYPYSGGGGALAGHVFHQE